MKNIKIQTQILKRIKFTTTLILFTLPTVTFAISAKFGAAPDNNQNLLVDALKSAHQDLTINVYQIDTPSVVDTIINKVSEGLSVNLIVEGSPVGNIGSAEHKALSAIKKAMSQSHNDNQHLYIMGAKRKGEKRRFRFDHAKYVVIDKHTVYISSENFTTTGHPDAGRVGNRGWSTLLEDADLAQQLIETFAEDSDSKFGDITEYTAPSETERTAPEMIETSSKSRQIAAVAEGQGDVEQVTLIKSPNSLNDILEIIRSARHSLRVEEMSLPLEWKTGGTEQDPIVTELVHAAEKGVKVEVLLNDDRVFSHSSSHEDNAPLKANEKTAQYLQSLGVRNKLPLEAKIVNIKTVGITYIHNKGIIVDDSAVLVSSINDTQNAIMNNREVGVLLTSTDAANYFTPIFDFDWQNSSELLEERAANPDYFSFMPALNNSSARTFAHSIFFN